MVAIALIVTTTCAVVACCYTVASLRVGYWLTAEEFEDLVAGFADFINPFK